MILRMPGLGRPLDPQRTTDESASGVVWSAPGFRGETCPEAWARDRESWPETLSETPWESLS